MSVRDFEMVIGLEVHVELKTAAKIFCGCSTAFGAEPNTQCCPVCTGMPGSLPVLNGQVVEYAVKTGLALNCRIAEYSKEDRKNYFYPDLPKAYQISQYDLPLCRHGWLDIETDAGPKRVGITRIHIEEDAGKLIHLEGQGTLIDCNRCGVPLIEIVSEPDLRSADEAKAYLQKLRAIILYTGVSDCRMNEGSLRCDVNLSVRRKGEETLGIRTEMKNLNSFQFIGKAIDYEFRRQVEVVEGGGQVVQETRRFDQATGKTAPMRKKEEADDYRYFPDPDLAPIEISGEWLSRMKEGIPVLPDSRKADYVARFGITPYAAEQLTVLREAADYFEQAAALTQYPKLAANLILSEMIPLLSDSPIPIAPEHTAVLADLLGEGRINSGTCRKLVARLWKEDGDPAEIVREQGLEQISDEAVLRPMAQRIVSGNPAAVREYRKGKTNAFQSLVGQMMKETGGRGNPVRISALLKELMDKADCAGAEEP